MIVLARLGEGPHQGGAHFFFLDARQAWSFDAHFLPASVVRDRPFPAWSAAGDVCFPSTGNVLAWCGWMGMDRTCYFRSGE